MSSCFSQSINPQGKNWQTTTHELCVKRSTRHGLSWAPLLQYICSTTTTWGLRALFFMNEICISENHDPDDSTLDNGKGNTPVGLMEMKCVRCCWCVCGRAAGILHRFCLWWRLRWISNFVAWTCSWLSLFNRLLWITETFICQVQPSEVSSTTHLALTAVYSRFNFISTFLPHCDVSHSLPRCLLSLP